MKKPLMFLTLLFVCYAVNAQISADINPADIIFCNNKINASLYNSTDTNYVLPKTLKAMTSSLMSNFTLGYDGYSQSSGGAAVKVGGDKTQANVVLGFFPCKKKSFYSTLNVTGKINEDILTIGNDGDYNGGFGANVSFYFKLNSSIFYQNKTNCQTQGRISKYDLIRLRKEYLLKKQIGYTTHLENGNLSDKRDKLIKFVDDCLISLKEYENELEKNNADALKQLGGKSVEDIFKEIEKAKQSIALISNCDDFLRYG